MANPNPNNLSPEKVQLRTWFNSTGKANGYKKSTLAEFFSKHREKPLSELKEKLENSKYVNSKAEYMDTERIKLRTWFYSTGEANGYKSTNLQMFFAKHREKPLSELKEILEGSKYLQPKPTEDQERNKLRDWFNSIGKANGYKANLLQWFFTKHREKPLSELKEILENSKYALEAKDDERIKLRDWFYSAGKTNGYNISTLNNFFTKHREKPLSELKEILEGSKYMKPNPTRYLIFSALMEVIDPYKEQIGQALLPYCNFIRGLGDHKESESFYLKKIVEDLKQFIPDEVAVEAFVYHHLRPVTHRGDVA